MGTTQSPASPAPLLGHNGLLAFESKGDILVANSDGSGVRALISGPALRASPSWSRDGTRLAYLERTNDTPGAKFNPDRDTFLLHVVDPDGKNGVELLKGKPVLLSQYESGGLAWSPDGTRLAISVREPVSATSTTVVPRVLIARTDGSGTDQLPVRIEALEPSWSPDGQRLAFRGGAIGSSYGAGVWVSALDGSALLEVSTGLGNEFAFVAPQWSPGGRSIAYQCGTDKHDICVADSAGGGERKVSTDAADEYSPGWSPDGAWLAFQRSTGPMTNDLYLVRPDGSELHKLDGPPTATNGGPLIWSPDGTMIAAYAPNLSALLLISVDGSKSPISIPAPGNSGIGLWRWQRLP